MTKNKDRYRSPKIFILIIPIGMILTFFLYDFGAKKYYQNKLNNDTYEILDAMLKKESLETKEEKKDFVESLYKEKGYKLSSLSILYTDDGETIIFAYDKNMSVVGTLSFGLVKSKKYTISSSYVGKLNEYNELVIEKFTENEEDMDIEIVN